MALLGACVFGVLGVRGVIGVLGVRGVLGCERGDDIRPQAATMIRVRMGADPRLPSFVRGMAVPDVPLKGHQIHAEGVPRPSRRIYERVGMGAGAVHS